MTNLLREDTTTTATCPRFGVCLSEPTFPDLSRLSPKSHLGRKLRRKAVDAYCVAHRQWEGRPAKSGPPILNSEKHGRRDFYTLEQAKRGGFKSGIARRKKAAAKWRAVTILAKRGKGVRQIARIVGYSAGWVSRLLRRLRGVFREHINHQPPERTQPVRGARTLTLFQLYADREPDGKRRGRLLGRLAGYAEGMRRKGYAEDAMKAASEYSRHLRRLPIELAVRGLNRCYALAGVGDAVIRGAITQ